MFEPRKVKLAFRVVKIALRIVARLSAERFDAILMPLLSGTELACLFIHH